jgi:hypothetical protein
MKGALKYIAKAAMKKQTSKHRQSTAKVMSATVGPFIALTTYKIMATTNIGVIAMIVVLTKSSTSTFMPPLALVL